MFKWLRPISFFCSGLIFAWGSAVVVNRIYPNDQFRNLSVFALRSDSAPILANNDPEYPVIASTLSANCVPASAPISVAFGNNHDAVYLEGNPNSAYPHYLLISGASGIGQLYGAVTLSAEPEAWQLLVPDYVGSGKYELDDAIRIGDTYYIFERRTIYAFSGDPADASGKWKAVAEFPEIVDDVAVHYDGQTVHLFGEYGDFEGRPDGTSIAYMTTDTEFSDWKLMHRAIVDPNTRAANVWGVGDASLFVTPNRVIMVTDLEADTLPYRLALWETEALGRVFNFAGLAAEPDHGNEGLRNHRVQDGEFIPMPDGKVLLFANWRDIDGNPGAIPEGGIVAMPDGTTRFIGGYTCQFE